MERGAQTEPEGAVPGLKIRALLVVVAFSVFVIVMNGSMTNVALPTIGGQFGATEAQAGWVITGYLLVFAVGVPLYGRLSDVYSVRKIFCAGLAGFALGSLVCALAPSLPILVAGRMLQAAGGAAIPALSSTSVARLLPPGRRGGALGLIVSSVGVGGAVGPVVGGIVVQLAGWHALFYGTLTLGLLLVPAALRVLPETPPEGGASFDLVGGLLLALSAGLLLFAVTEGQPLGLLSPILWGACLVALLSGVAFARRIRRVPAPFVSPRLLSNRAYLACCAVGFFGMFANLTSIVFVPLLLLDVAGLGAGAAGLALAPGAVAVALLAPLAGRMSDRVGPRPPILLGLLVLALSMLLLSTIGAGDSYPVVVLGMLGAGVGFAGFSSPNTNATAATLPREEIGVGLGIYQMLFFLGGAAGPAILGSYLAARPQGLGALNPFYASGPEAAPYSDAFLILALCALLAAVAAVWGSPDRQKSGTPGRDVRRDD